MSIRDIKQEHSDELMVFVQKYLEYANKRKFTGSMQIALRDGVITSFKPSPIYGVSTILRQWEI